MEVYYPTQHRWYPIFKSEVTLDCVVIIPALNRPHRVRPTVESIRETSDADILFLITVGYGKQIQALKEVGCNFIALPEAKKGDYARKINHGYRETEHDLIFLGADDLLFHPNWLENAVSRLDDKIQVVGTNDLGNERVLAGVHATHSLVTRKYADGFGTMDGPGRILCEEYWHEYCQPLDIPIWMGDCTFRDLGDVKVGDEVMGWERVPAGKHTLRALRKSRVLASRTRMAPLIRVVMESGRVLRCTPDHRWLNAKASPIVLARHPGRSEWITAKVGRTLLHVMDEPPPVEQELQWTAGYLAGIYDGEAHGIQIAQCPTANPAVSTAIAEALVKLDIPFTRNGLFFTLTGGRQAYVDFLLRVGPQKTGSLESWIMGRGRTPEARSAGAIGGRFGHQDKIVAVEEVGEAEVMSMTTSTGNYVAQGYASRNCDDELVETAKYRQAWAFAADSVVEHMHPCWKKAPDDGMYRQQALRMDYGRPIFEKRKHLWSG